MRVAVVLLSVLAAASACTSGNSFDNLQLVQQYAPVDCPQSAPVQCNGTNTAFTTLHGLWPSIGGDGPCQCTDQTFDVNEVKPIMNLLDKYWPSYDGSNTDFWTHEYEKHGTCAESIPQLSTELDFFTVAVQLLQKYNVIPMLAAGGITPQDGVSVSLSDAQSAVEQSFGYKPQFNCKDGMMESAILCFDKSLNPTECTGLSSQCDSSFIIPQSQQP